MNKFQELSELLNKQFEIHTKLFEIEQNKTDIILKGGITEIENILNLQQPYIMSSANLEKQRELLQIKMGIEGLTLREIINLPDANFLEKNFNLMSDLLINLKRICTKNNKLLNTRLELLGYILSESGVKKDYGITYSQNNTI